MAHRLGPNPDGSVALDFNQATNLPCAFTDFLGQWSRTV